jgi:hypothetical protein
MQGVMPLAILREHQEVEHLAVAALSACQRRSAALPVPGEQFEFGRCRKSSLSKGTESRAKYISNANSTTSAKHQKTFAGLAKAAWEGPQSAS